MSEEPRKRVVGYVRVSVDNVDKVSPEMQAEAIETQCKLKGWDVAEMIVERGRSAGEDKLRPGMDRARKMIRRGKASGLVVWKIDRCARSVKNFAEIISELRKHKADFVSVTEAFDTSTSMGKAMLQITMVFAELERDRASERITAWHDYRRRQGKVLGDAAMPLGYYREKKVDDTGVERSIGPWLVDEDAAAVVKGMFEVFLETGSSVVAQRYLAAQGYPRVLTGVRSLLKSTLLAGVRLVDGQPLVGEWPAIIDWDTHLAVVAALEKRSRGKRGRPKVRRWLLTSIAVCGRCGQPMMANDLSGARTRYQCATVKNDKGTVGPKCSLSIGRPHLDAYVERLVLHRISPEDWRRMRERRSAMPVPPVVDVAALEAKMAELAEDYYVKGLITRTEFEAARIGLTTRLADAEAENEAAGDDDDDDYELPDVADLHRAWREDRLTTEQKRLVIDAVVDRITVAPGFLIPGRKNGWAPVEDRVEIFWR